MSAARRAGKKFPRVPTPIVALDVPTAAQALALVERLGRSCSFYKVGSELFAAAGPAFVDFLRARGANVFLDLKLHDIPNTVERAAAEAARMGARLITVHAVAGRDAVRAAVAGAAQGGECGVLAVTVLTSLDAKALGESWGRKLRGIAPEVLRLAAIAKKAGADGIVCGGPEAAAVRRKFGDALAILVPGVRPRGSARGDQVRTITPGEAARVGVDYVVLGRSVTAANDPSAVLASVIEELLTAV